MRRRLTAVMFVAGVALAIATPAQGASGNFEQAWGKDVNGGGVFGVCTVAASCQVGAPGPLGGELNSPGGAATDAEGNLYVAEISSNRIQKFDPSGNFLLAWGKDVVSGNAETGFEICTVAASCQAGGIGGLGGELNGPYAVASDGESPSHLYVTDTFNHRIQKFDPSGNFLRAWGKNVGILGSSGFEICGTAGLCQAGQVGGLGGELDFPRGAATDGDGNLYVTDTSNNRIQRYDPSGNFATTWGKDVVSSNAESGFEICTTAASCKAGAAGGLGGELNLPQGAATDAAFNLNVTDTSNHRVQKFDPSGNFLRAWGKNVGILGSSGFEICGTAGLCQAGQVGGLGGELDFPRGAATDGDGNLYVTDTSNNRIQRYDPSGNFATTWGKDVVSGNAETGFEICTVAASCQAGGIGGLGGELNGPYAVASDGESPSHLYVTDSFNHRIQKFDLDHTGNFLETWGRNVDQGGGIGFEICTAAATCKAGENGALGGELGTPIGAATDAAGDLYVTDSANNQIQKFASSGNFLRAWGKDVDTGGGTGFEICTAAVSCQPGQPGGLGGEVSSPFGVATDAAGDLYVADTFNQRIQKFDNLEPSPPTGTGSSGDTSQGDTGGTQGTANPQCQVLRKKLKRAKTKAAKKRIRGKLRRLGCR